MATKTEIFEARRLSHAKLAAKCAARDIPRAPKNEEHLVELRIDANGEPHRKGDIIIDMAIRSASHPGLCGDWVVVAARPVFTRRHDGEVAGWYRYMIVSPAATDQAAMARDAAAELAKKSMDWGMNS